MVDELSSGVREVVLSWSLCLFGIGVLCCVVQGVMEVFPGNLVVWDVVELIVDEYVVYCSVDAIKY